MYTYRLGLAAIGLALMAAANERLPVDDLVAEALASNPEILAAQKRYEAARIQSRVDGALPDPMVGLGWNSSGGPLPFQGVGREPIANVGMMVTQPLPYPGKRSLREQMASREADAEWQNYRAVRFGVASRVKQAYFRLQHTWESQEVLERNRELLKRLLEVAEIRYSVGRAMQADLLRTQAQLTLIETRMMQFTRERRAREAEINALLNRPLDAPLPRPVDPHAEPLRVTADELMARATDDSPMLRREEKVIQRNEVALAMARREYYPDLAVTGGYYYMGRMPNMYMFRLDVNVPVWWARKQRPAVTAEANRVAEARRSWQASTRNIEYRIKDDYLMAQTALDLMNLYRTTLIPQADLTWESSLSSYETGTGGFTEVLMSAMTAADYEMEWHAQMEAYHLALARLEEMTGVELIHSGGRP